MTTTDGSETARRDAAEARHQRELATAVHELRTPLATIRGFIETLLARGGELSEDAERRILEIARRNAVLLGQRIDTLLDHERFTTGHVQLVPREVLLDEIVDEIVEDCAGLLADHTVEVEVPANTAARVDGVALAHVLGNLLSNAGKHSPAGSIITIRIRARPEEAAVAIEVVDHGTGISEHDLDRVFDPYFRAEDGPSGMGLGLSVVQRYVALWGGDLDIVSTLGEGTTVSFTVPAATVDDEVVDLTREESVEEQVQSA